MQTAIIDRFLAHVAMPETADGCWLWRGSLNRPNGYGTFTLGPKTDRKSVGAHRWSYEYHVGSIPQGLDIDHLCRTRNCVNPAHMEPVTRRINSLRGDTFQAANAAKTHCPQGHPYDAANTQVTQWGGGYCRHCRTCNRERTAARKAS